MNEYNPGYQSYSNGIPADSVVPLAGMFEKPFFNLIYFKIKNNSYEVIMMWCLIIVTIILLLSLLVKGIEDETERIRAIVGATDC